MNTQALLLTVSLAAAGIGSAHAEHFRPSAAANGAVIGGIAGAFIGGHNNDRWGQGALIGAAAGAILGGIFGGARGVAIGAGAGAGAGAAVAMATKGPRVSIPSETRLSFTIQ